MSIDYSKIPTQDLQALVAGDYSKVSTPTLKLISSGPDQASNPSILSQIGQGVRNIPNDITNYLDSKTSINDAVRPGQTGVFGQTFASAPQQLQNMKQVNQGIGESVPLLAAGLSGFGAEAAAAPLIEDAASYLPTEVLPKIASLLGKGAIGGAAGNAAIGQNPLKGAEYGSLLAGGGSLAGKALSLSEKLLSKGLSKLPTLAGSKNALQKSVLDYMNNQNAKGAILSPQEAAENIQANYLDKEGNRLPIDAGTVVNSPTLSNLYKDLKPMSVSLNPVDNLNSVKNQMYDSKINNIQNAIQSLNYNPNFESELPNVLESLKSGLSDPKNITKEQSSQIKGQYDSLMNDARDLYKPINNSKVRLDTLPKGMDLSNYKSNALDLLAQQENLRNIFGSSSDLGGALNAEIEKAKNMLNLSNGKNTVKQLPSKWGVSLSDAVERTKNLGDLARSAKSNGNYNEARLLGNLRDGLQTDIDTTLRKNNLNDLADQLQSANEFYRNRIIPYHGNQLLRKIVKYNYVPRGSELSRQLFDPNNEQVLSDTPTSMKNASLYQLMTGGKGTSLGKSNLNPKQIAARYQTIPVDTKSKVAQFNPTADAIFENAPYHLGVKDVHDKLLNQIQSLKNEKASASQLSSSPYKSSTKVMPEASKAGLLHMMLNPSQYLGYLASLNPIASRNLARILPSQDLIDAYINQKSFPDQKLLEINPDLKNIAKSAAKSLGKTKYGLSGVLSRGNNNGN